jgi:putative peptidoglycan lipid II flippase
MIDLLIFCLKVPTLTTNILKWSRSVRLIKSAFSVATLTILSRMAGFLREMLQAHYFGAGVINDALKLAIRIPSVFRRIFAEGAFNASFIPIFSSILTSRGKKEAIEFAQNIFSILAITLAIISLVIELFLPQFISLLYPGLSKTPERLMYTIEFTRIMFPFLLFISLTAFFSGILNSFERFVAAASSPIAGNLVIIGTLLYLGSHFDNMGKAFSWGIFLCGLIQFLWVFAPCSLRVALVLPKTLTITKDVKDFFQKMIPAALGSGIVQINIFLDMMIGSFLPTGSISYMGYADRLNQLPLSTIGIAISTVLLPLLSKQIKKGQDAAAQYSQDLAVEFSLALTMPAFIGLILLAPILVETIFQHGKFQPQDVLPTAKTLIAFASGLPAYVLLKVFSTSFFARGDTKTPMIAAAICLTLNVLLNLLLMRRYAHVGIALATSFSAWINLFILMAVLRRKGFFSLSKTLRESLYRIGLVSFLFFIALYIGQSPMLSFLESISTNRFWILGGMVGFSLIAYLGMAYPLKVLHWKDLRKRLKQES